MLLRDVLARFAVQVDDKPMTKLDRQIERAKDKLKTFGAFAAGGFAVAGTAAYKFVNAASHAAETLNVLEQTFGKNTGAVLGWSKTMGKELGRSEYTLQEYASNFGSFLEPMFRGTDKDITAMSERLSALAVDLASFYNTSDDESKTRLFSGLAGETEAVRRFGVDVSDGGLQAFADANGDHRRVASMSQTEKVLLRYKKILRDTELKQGDAARTSEGWANSLKRLQERLKTLSVRVGQVLYGPATKLLHWGERFAETVGDITLHTNAWQAAFATAAGVGIAKGAQWLLLHKDLVKWSDLLNKQFWVMNAKVLGVASAFLLLEDLWTMMRGGKSVFGDFITELTGIQRPADLLTASFEKMAQHIHNMGVYLGQVWRNMVSITSLVSGDFAGTNFGWDTSGKIDETKSEALARTRPKAAQAAVLAGDKHAYEAAMEGSGLSDQEITANFLRDRKTALRLKQVEANDMDLGSGLIDVPKFATVSNADRRRYYGGASNTTNSVTVNVANSNASPDDIARVVSEKLDERARQTAAEVGEFADELDDAA